VVSSQVSISVAWAISQYRQALATIGQVGRGVARTIRAPQEAPEVVRYFRQIGIGRNIDVYV
jgi:hypothetical protein